MSRSDDKKSLGEVSDDLFEIEHILAKHTTRIAFNRIDWNNAEAIYRSTTRILALLTLLSDNMDDKVYNQFSVRADGATNTLDDATIAFQRVHKQVLRA